MSRANFFRLFERETGITPRMYLNVVRLEHAVEAAVDTDVSFANTADDLGFSSPGHFTRFFSGTQVSRQAGSVRWPVWLNFETRVQVSRRSGIAGPAMTL